MLLAVFFTCAAGRWFTPVCVGSYSIRIANTITAAYFATEAANCTKKEMTVFFNEPSRLDPAKMRPNTSDCKAPLKKHFSEEILD